MEKGQRVRYYVNLAAIVFLILTGFAFYLQQPDRFQCEVRVYTTDGVTLLIESELALSRDLYSYIGDHPDHAILLRAEEAYCRDALSRAVLQLSVADVFADEKQLEKKARAEFGLQTKTKRYYLPEGMRFEDFKIVRVEYPKDIRDALERLGRKK